MERVKAGLEAVLLLEQGEAVVNVVRKGEFIPIRQIDGERGGMRA